MPGIARSKRAFTLIELLIVIAIIAILALIAVPNFLEAQTRAKVTRLKADFRTILTAMQAYAVDYGTYPDDELGRNRVADFGPFTLLTTPVAYLSSVPTNPFFDVIDTNKGKVAGSYAYWAPRAGNLTAGGTVGNGVFFHVTSVGPNQKSDLGGKQMQVPDVAERNAIFINRLYNPTNGTLSYGDMHFCNLGISE